ncbi:zinc finger BED domain-containing protein 5-like [Centruroides sculpturatus]|uniref:zinc finger BED domain-containing protein 5-like n=1 Tax=Centruroides sculpturatus TaxID=218467 RepID=UPI000C6DE9CB|nr:zinc finger BED domain-containing protein 5-like [Centruroides sculpturatus]
MDQWLKRINKATTSKEDTEKGELAKEQSATTSSKNTEYVPSCSEQQPGKNKCKYDPQYLSYGFTSTGDEEAPDAICILCHTRLANSSLAPSKLQRHMDTRHSVYKNKDKYSFERKLESFNKTTNFVVKKYRTDNENATEASYKASYHISLLGKAHTIGESLIKPILKDVVSCVFDEKSAQKVESISLSNDTVSRHISGDIETELNSRLHVMLTRCKWMSLQMWLDWQFYLCLLDMTSMKQLRTICFSVKV